MSRAPGPPPTTNTGRQPDRQPGRTAGSSWKTLAAQVRADVTHTFFCEDSCTDPDCTQPVPWDQARAADPDMTAAALTAVTDMFTATRTAGTKNPDGWTIQRWAAETVVYCVHMIASGVPFAVFEAGARAGWEQDVVVSNYSWFVRPAWYEFQKPHPDDQTTGPAGSRLYTETVTGHGQRLGPDRTADTFLLMILTGLTATDACGWVIALADGPGPNPFFPPISTAQKRTRAIEMFVEDVRRWVTATGPDGWVWPTAGYTLDQARLLLALPVGHPDRPGPDQLAVMAALRAPE